MSGGGGCGGLLSNMCVWMFHGCCFEWQPTSIPGKTQPKSFVQDSTTESSPMSYGMYNTCCTVIRPCFKFQPTADTVQYVLGVAASFTYSARHVATPSFFFFITG